MVTVTTEPKLTLPYLDILAPNSSEKVDIDDGGASEIKQVEEPKSDHEFERKMKSLKDTFKRDISWEVKRRKFFNPKRNKPGRRTFLPPPIDDPLAGMILRCINAAELTLDGVMELPSAEGIVGAVIIVRVRETGELLCSLDKLKHGRWGFPGGRRDPKDLNIAHTLLRELKEETRLRGKRFRYAFIGLVPIVRAYDKTAAVFFTEISETVMASVRPGREQRELRLFSRAQIYEMILKWEFLENHTNYLFMLERWEAMNK